MAGLMIRGNLNPFLKVFAFDDFKSVIRLRPLRFPLSSHAV